MDELGFALRFPFTDEAKRAIEGMQLNERIIELGAERVKKALKGASASKLVFNEGEIKEEIASYAAARMILGSLRNQFITSRFAVNESKMVRSHLDKSGKETIDRVAKRFGIKTKNNLLDIPTYLRYSPRSQHYRLINRKIFNGFVEVKEAEKSRLIEEGVRRHIEDIPLVKDPPVAMKKAGEKILEELPKTQTTITVKKGDHPPCIMKLLESVKKHENLPHHARWFLATYMFSINMSDDAVMNLYASLPDFSEKVTKYQIKHIRNRGYNVPACSTVMSYGLCCAVCRVGNPLKWHNLTDRRKGGIKK
jgi:DNA primase large subunit